MSRRIVSDKHALTVRVTDEDYKEIRKMAERMDMSPNEWMAYIAVREAKKKE